jgi:hypothetical protein
MKLSVNGVFTPASALDLASGTVEASLGSARFSGKNATRPRLTLDILATKL